jgi:hypothetical protein
MASYSDAEYDEWYDKLMGARNTDVLVSLDRDLRKITIYLACADYKRDCLLDAISDFDSASLVGLHFERETGSPDTYVIEVNGAWNIDKICLQLIERIKLEGVGIDVQVQDTSLS